MFRLGFDRASAVARARENLMKAMHPTKWFSSVYGGSAISSSAQTALTKYALQVVKAEPLLCQLGPEQVLGMGAPTGHTQIHSSNLSSSNLIIMKLRDCLYRLPLHYFGSQSLIHKLVASRVGQGPVSLPDDLDTSDWEAFLKIITARPYDQPEPSFAFAEWMGGLRVAKKLDQDCALVYIFGQIQKAYPKQNPVDLLEAARLADASHSPWLQDRYAILSQRSTAISSEEMRRMGEDAAAEVCKMREQAAYQRGKTDGEASSLDPKPSYPAKSRDLDETPPDSPARPVYLKASYPAKTRDLDETRPDSPATPMGLRASYPAKSRGPDKTPPDSPARSVYLNASYPVKPRDLDETRPDSPPTPMGLRASYPAKSRGPDKTPPDSPARSVYLNASYPVKPRDLDETRPDSPPTPMGLRASYPAKSRGPDKTPPDSPARPVYLNASYSAKTRDLDETPPDSPATPMGLKASYPAKSRGPDKTPPDSPAMPVYLNASYSVKPRDLDETRPDSPPTPMGLKHSYPARADETPRVKRNYPEEDLIDSMSSVSTPFTESAPTLSPVTPTTSLQDCTEGDKHGDFYFCNFIDVKTGDGICSFPSSLVESSILREKLHTPKESERLNLEGFSHSEVRAFLEVADARLVSGDKHYSFQQWVSALSVANHLQLDHIRFYAAKSIEDGLIRLDPFECIEVAEKHGTQEWLLQPFRRICQRPEPLSSSEILRLGLDRASAVSKARENLMKMVHSRGLFDKIYGGSALPSCVQTTFANDALQVVKAEPLLCQLMAEHAPRPSDLGDHPETYTSTLSSSNLISINLRDCLYRLPLHYFGNCSLIHKLAASNVAHDPISLPSDLTTSEWEVFLKIITARPYDQPELSVAFSEWMGGLRVARKLNHNRAQAYIFRQIQKAYPDQDAVNLLEAARLAEVPHSQWIQDRYTILSLRSTAISSEEMRRIGEDASAEVCKLREQNVYQRGKKDGESASAEGCNAREQAAYERGKKDRKNALAEACSVKEKTAYERGKKDGEGGAVEVCKAREKATYERGKKDGEKASADVYQAKEKAAYEKGKKDMESALAEVYQARERAAYERGKKERKSVLADASQGVEKATREGGREDGGGNSTANPWTTSWPGHNWGNSNRNPPR
ncbi:hypothetical protein FRC01_002985 [Tulasnella sp. 417]|nr:hypothetical protein FRC01_002985 [Tulasnella sp. 417]